MKEITCLSGVMLYIRLPPPCRNPLIGSAVGVPTVGDGPSVSGMTYSCASSRSKKISLPSGDQTGASAWRHSHTQTGRRKWLDEDVARS